MMGRLTKMDAMQLLTSVAALLCGPVAMTDAADNRSKQTGQLRMGRTEYCESLVIRTFSPPAPEAKLSYANNNALLWEKKVIHPAK